MTTCKNCGRTIIDDREEATKPAPLWRTEGGDFGCDFSPETCEQGVGSHEPRED